MKKLLVVLAVLFASVAAYAGNGNYTPPAGTPGTPVTQDAKITVDVVCPLKMDVTNHLYWRLIQGTVLAPTSSNTILFTIEGCHWGGTTNDVYKGSQLDLTYSIIPKNTYATGGVELKGDIDYKMDGASSWTPYVTDYTIGGVAVPTSGTTTETVDFTANKMFVQIKVDQITVDAHAEVTAGYYEWTFNLSAEYTAL